MIAIYRIIVIVPMTSVAIASSAAVVATGNSSDSQAFSVELSPTGELPVTHWGLDTGADENMRQVLSNKVMLNYHFWTFDRDTLELVASSEQDANDISWSAQLAFDEAIASVGLQRVKRSSMNLP